MLCLPLLTDDKTTSLCPPITLMCQNYQPSWHQQGWSWAFTRRHQGTTCFIWRFCVHPKPNMDVCHTLRHQQLRLSSGHANTHTPQGSHVPNRADSPELCINTAACYRLHRQGYFPIILPIRLKRRGSTSGKVIYLFYV